MDDMIELEDYCVFCSKYLAGMHDFNKKMHFNTCKLRKLFDSVYTNSDNSDDTDQFFMDDNCSFCLKSLKDFKSDYNRRIHLKCCKIKKETFDRRDSILQLQQSEVLAQSATTSTQSNESHSLFQSLTEACIFCNKPLSNLNSFNRKMHIEHCKIRKSLEGYVRPRAKNKSENLVKQDTGAIDDHCIYCNKSFARLSDFNRRLHSEHCKTKKRKLKTLNNVLNSSLNLSSIHESNYGSSLDQVQNSLILLANSSCPNISLSANSSLDIASSSDQSNIQNSSLSTQIPISTDPSQLCEFCSRSLANLSNFNKNIHIEQCKLKQSKKITNGVKQLNKQPRKRVKTEKMKSNQNEFCSSQIMTHLDLSSSNDLTSTSTSIPNSNSNMSSISNSDNSISSKIQLGHQYNQPNSATIISLDNTTLHQLSLAANQHSQNLINGGTHTLQITLDPNTNQIYI